MARPLHRRQTDRMSGDACTEEQIEAMVRHALDMPYAFWIRAMHRPQARLSARFPSGSLATHLKVSLDGLSAVPALPPADALF